MLSSIGRFGVDLLPLSFKGACQKSCQGGSSDIWAAVRLLHGHVTELYSLYVSQLVSQNCHMLSSIRRSGVDPLRTMLGDHPN